MEVVDDVGDDLGIGQQVALVAEHFDETPVRVIGGDLAVMYYRVVEQGEGVSAAPPTGCVRRVAAVYRPRPAVVLVETVEFADVLRVADRLEYAHVLAAGENVSAVDLVVYLDDAAGNVGALVELALLELCGKRVNEVAPDKRLVGDVRVLSGGNTREVDDVEMAVDERLGLYSRLVGIVENMERVLILVLRINAVSGVAAAQTVRAVVHTGNGIHDHAAVCPSAAPVDKARDRAARRDPCFSLFH